ncbi:unnamed protein product [Amoebophrya sp. A120]|nr:unnamed protein product [Amoebophrya sp. A120]|eukprot:GSA120T00012661001.1
MSDGCKVFVGNLRRDVQKSELEKIFQEHGDIRSTWIAKSPPGFAFIVFNNPDDASKAVSELHGYQADFCESNGQGLRVEVSTGGPGGRKRESSRDRGSRRFLRSRSRGGGRDRGGRGGRKESRGRDRRRDSRGRGGRSRR